LGQIPVMLSCPQAWLLQPDRGTLGPCRDNRVPDRSPRLPPLALADMVADIAGAGVLPNALSARAKGRTVDLTPFGVLGPWAPQCAVAGKLP